jgi:hypothetical protein
MVGSRAGGLTGGQQEHVLNEGREHVPGFEVEEGADEIQSVGGEERNGDVPEGCIVPDQSSRDLSVGWTGACSPREHTLGNSSTHRECAAPPGRQYSRRTIG